MLTKEMFRKIISIVCSIVLFLTTSAYTQQAETSKWHGYGKKTFSFEGRDAHIIVPPKMLPGNPWIWRAYFPDWHYEMDSILVSAGFHIAFIDCSDMFGNPEAMRLWEKFYQYLTSEYSFSKRPVLEGVSRGGLYVYGWAKRNPDKVSFIYAEAPVLDIKSWPGGKGKGLGSKAEWEKCLPAYHFTGEQALDFKDNPIDQIEAFASYKVPVVHVISMSDSIVPVEENTAIIEKRMMLVGGNITVYKMTEEVRSQGHHFNITNPQHYAELIISKTVPVKDFLPSSSFIAFNGMLNNAMSVIKNRKEITVAFLGGSITYNIGWRDKLCRYFQETYPQTKFRFIPAGIPSLGSLPHTFRLQSDVLDKGNIDLLFVESAVNDHANKTKPTIQQRAIEGIIRHALSTNPAMDIVLMAFADEDKIMDYEKNIESTEIKIHRKLAEHYGLPFINLSKEVYERIKQGEFTWKEDFKDLHPSPFGQNVYFQTIKTMLQLAEIKYKGESIVPAKLPRPQNEGVYDKGLYGRIYQATNLKGFSVVDHWKPSDQKPTRAGYVNVPVLEAVEAGSSFSLTFKGDAVGIAIVSGPDAGIIEYRIDKGKTKTLNLFTEWSHSLHLPWYLMLADELKNVEHTLEVRISSSKRNSGGNACRIVHFLVNK